MSTISKAKREKLKKLCKLLERGENIITKEILRLKNRNVSGSKAEDAKKRLIEKHEGTVGRMIFVREEIEELLKMLPKPIPRKKRIRHRGPAIRLPIGQNIEFQP